MDDIHERRLREAYMHEICMRCFWGAYLLALCIWRVVICVMGMMGHTTHHVAFLGYISFLLYLHKNYIGFEACCDIVILGYFIVCRELLPSTHSHLHRHIPARLSSIFHYATS